MKKPPSGGRWIRNPKTKVLSREKPAEPKATTTDTAGTENAPDKSKET